MEARFVFSLYVWRSSSSTREAFETEHESVASFTVASVPECGLFSVFHTKTLQTAVFIQSRCEPESACHIFHRNRASTSMRL